MPKFYLLPVTGLLLFIVPSCEKRHDPNNGTILRQSVVDRLSSGVVATNYVYNETGRLVRLQLVTNPDQQDARHEALLLEFNNAGALIKSYNAEAGNSAYNIQEYSYNISLDTIQSLTTLYRFQQPAYARQIILDNFQRVLSDSTRAIPTGDITFSSFTWDAAGNMATEKSGILVNGVISYNSQLTYTYDTHRNPLRDFWLPYYLATGDAKVFNSNNVLTLHDGNFRYTWQHKYNTSDLPLETVMPIFGGERKLQFYYR